MNEDDARRALRDADVARDQATTVLEHAERRVQERRSDTFVCPVCSMMRSKVTNSRGTIAQGCVRRRRECLECGARYSTIERIVIGSLARKTA